MSVRFAPSAPLTGSALLAAGLAPAVALVVLTVALGLLGAATAAGVVGVAIVPVWAVGLGRALFLDHARS